MRSRTAPIPCPSPPLPAGSPSVHSNGARERTLQGAVTTARRGDYQMTAGSGRRASTYGTASTVTFNGSVNDVFLTYGEKCVLSPNTDNKSLNGLFHFYGHQKTGVTSTPTSSQLITGKSHRLDPSDAVY